MSSAAAHEPTSDATRSASARVAELFERHGRMVYGVCRAMLRDAHEAEDATQQTFLSVYRALLGGAGVRDPGAWITTIARNECRSRISAGMRAPLPAPDGDLSDVPNRTDEVERRMQSVELRDALATLPERQREAVVLRYVYGLRYGEVATALALSRPAAEALLFRARRAMRLRLRHAISTVLVVPLAVREELALAIPGFEAPSGSGAAAAGIAGGVLAKLASAPVAAKIATATVAISAVGAVGAVESDPPVSGSRTEALRVSEARSGASARAKHVFSRIAASPHRAERSAGRRVTGGRAADDHQGDDSGNSGGREAPPADGAGSPGTATGRGSSSQGTASDEASRPDEAPSGSSGPGPGERTTSELDDVRSTSGSSPISSGGPGPSGPGSGGPGTALEEDGSHGSSGSSGSGSSGSGSSGSGTAESGSDDGSSSSGSGEEPDEEKP